MRRMILFIAALGLAIGHANSPAADPPPPKRPLTAGPIRRPAADGWFFGREVLVAYPGIQSELKLDDDQKRQIDETMAENRRAALEQLFRQRGLTGDTAEAKRRRLEAERQIQSLYQEAVERTTGFLNRPQADRLEQLQLQREGIPAVRFGKVASKLGLTDDQNVAIGRVLRAFQKIEATIPPDLRNRSTEERQTFLATIAKALKERDKNLLAILTPEQRQKWEQLLGEKFDFAVLRAPSQRGPRSPQTKPDPKKTDEKDPDAKNSDIKQPDGKE